jgi:hypothetical protein
MLSLHSAALYLPAAHWAHGAHSASALAVQFRVLKLPCEHVKQARHWPPLPAPQEVRKKPWLHAAHARQADAPTEELKLSAGQSRQAVEALASENLPACLWLVSLGFVFSNKAIKKHVKGMPATQLRQAVDVLALENLPTAHESHAVFWWLLVAEKVPAAHATQRPATTPSQPLRYVPAGHVAQGTWLLAGGCLG